MNREQDTDDIDVRESNKNARMWAVAGNHYSPCEAAVSKLVPGNYRIALTERGIYFVKRDLATDNLLELPDSATEKILEHMKVFWSREEKYREYKFIWKRGILLHGPPGGGKTSTVELLAKMIISNLQGVVIHIDDPAAAIMGLEAFRFIEPKTPLLLVVEDIDAVLENRGESALLNLLDGEFQTDNIVVVATTNYMERLDKRIRNRPSRFDVVMKIELPSDDARRMYLKHVHKRFVGELSSEVSKELEVWVKDTKGFSIAHLKELVLAVEVLEGKYPEQLNRLREMMNLRASSSDDNRKPGFGFSD